MGLGSVRKYSLADGVRKAWQKFYPLILLWIYYNTASILCFRVFFFFFGWEACGIPVPRPGIKPASRSWKVKSQGKAREVPCTVAFSYFCKKDPCMCVSHVGLGKSRPALRTAPNAVECKVTSYLSPEMVQRFLNERWKSAASMMAAVYFAQWMVPT